MSTLKVDTIEHETATSAIDMPNKLKVGGAGVEQGYTASETQPTDGETGDFWWDSANEKIYRYIDGEFKELTGSGGSSGGGTYSGDRAVIFGGYQTGGDGGTYHQMSYFDITSPGNATDFGDMLYETQNSCAFSNGTRGVVSGGSVTKENYQYITIATTGNSQDFGDLYYSRYSAAGFSDGTYGVTAMGIGYLTSGGVTTVANTNGIEYVTIATLGNGTDFGDATENGKGCAGAANSTYGLIAGGNASGVGGFRDTVSYITIATPGNATDFGDMDDGREYFGMTGSATRVLYVGGDT